MDRTKFNFTVNLGLLFTGMVMVFSGLTIQIGYHMGNHGSISESDKVLGFSYQGWSVIHKVSILIITNLMVFHFIRHWKYYQTVISKHLVRKNRQKIILTVIFLLTAITGFVPWIIRLSGGEETTRNGFIEIHDKLALVLFIYLFLHVAGRLKWYVKTFLSLFSFGR